MAETDGDKRLGGYDGRDRWRQKDWGDMMAETDGDKKTGEI